MRINRITTILAAAGLFLFGLATTSIADCSPEHTKSQSGSSQWEKSGTPSTDQSTTSTQDQSGTTPGQSGTTPGQSNTTPGHSGTTPGQSGTTPDQSGGSVE